MCACHQFGYFRIPSASSIQHLVPETRYASSKISSSRPISGRNWKDHQDQQVARWGSKGPRGQMTTSSNLLMNYIGSFFSLNSLPPPLASYGHWEVISHYWPHERGGGKRGRGRGGASGSKMDQMMVLRKIREPRQVVASFHSGRGKMSRTKLFTFLFTHGPTHTHTHTHTHTFIYIYIYIYMYINRKKKSEI